LDIRNWFFRLDFVGFSSFPPDAVLGGRIFGRRERKIVEERRGRGGGAMILFARARPHRSSSPMPGSGYTHETHETHAVLQTHTSGRERKLWFARAPILQIHAGGRERRSWFAGARLHRSSPPMLGFGET
jgi:hypothetical protein